MEFLKQYGFKPCPMISRLSPCPCGIPVPAPNKPEPKITIKHGDSTDAIGASPIVLTIHTKLDLTGCTIIFSFLGFEQRFTELEKDENDDVHLGISMTATQTASLPLGFQFASVFITDGSNNTRTLMDNILVLVTDSAEIAYGANNNMTININMNDEAIKTILSGQSWDAGGTIGSLRDFLAKIGEALGATVTERETP